MCHNYLLFFFFQAEDGIRDVAVTGVQTCALPIWRAQSASLRARRETRPPESGRETAAAPPRLFSRQAGRPAPSKARGAAGRGAPSPAHRPTGPTRAARSIGAVPGSRAPYGMPLPGLRFAHGNL